METEFEYLLRHCPPGWLAGEPQIDLLWASPLCTPLEASGVQLSTEEIHAALAPLTSAGYEFTIHHGPDGECSVRIPNLPPCQDVSAVRSWPRATTGGLASVFLDQNIIIAAVGFTRQFLPRAWLNGQFTGWGGTTAPDEVFER